MDLPELIERHKKIAQGAGGDVRLSHATATELERLRDSLLMCAASCQGGHSDAGMSASQALGIPFPVSMDGLVAKAKEWGLNPDHLWPWLMEQRRKRNSHTAVKRS